MWHPWRTEQTQYLMVYWDLNTFSLVLPSSSHRSYHHSFPMSDDFADMRAQPRTAHSDGVVPRMIPPPLLLSESRQKHPRLPSNPQHRISVNSLQSHVLASNHFTSWLTPYGITRMNSESSR